MQNDTGIDESVSKYGWAAVPVADATPPFIYTIGLMFSYKHPELIVFGLPESGHALLCRLVEQIEIGFSFTAPEACGNLVPGIPLAARPVHETQHELYLGYAMGYCRERGKIGELKALQVFWADNSGRFPFDAGCNKDVWSLQPRLDVPLTKSELRAWRKQWGIDDP